MAQAASWRALRRAQGQYLAPLNNDTVVTDAWLKQLVGPRLTALIAYLKGACPCSYSTIRKFIRDVLGFQIILPNASPRPVPA